MSFVVSNACNKRKFGRGQVKQIIMYLADKASDDGGGIWCSKYTIARETENSLSTVKRAIRELVKGDVLIEIGARDCDRGRTIVYRICLDAVKQLPLLRPPKEVRLELTGVSLHPVTDDPSTGVCVTPVAGPHRPPNHPQTTLEPSLSKSLLNLQQATADFWNAYPKDRRRKPADCAALIQHTLANGCSADELLAATIVYNRETASNTRTRVCFADNWLRQRRWVTIVEDIRIAKVEAEALEIRNAQKVASRIKRREPMCVHLVNVQIEDVIRRGFVSTEEVRLAGVKI